jgi:hypothetical protein
MGNTNNMNIKKHLNSPDEQSNVNKKNVSIKTVAVTYFGSLLVALIITWGFAGFRPSAIRWAYLFPFGCITFVNVPDSFLKYGYVVYVVMYILAFLLRQKQIFITLLVIYIVILCLNINGCRMIMNIDIH